MSYTAFSFSTFYASKLCYKTKITCNALKRGLTSNSSTSVILYPIFVYFMWLSFSSKLCLFGFPLNFCSFRFPKYPTGTEDQFFSSGQVQDGSAVIKSGENFLYVCSLCLYWCIMNIFLVRQLPVTHSRLELFLFI